MSTTIRVNTHVHIPVHVLYLLHFNCDSGKFNANSKHHKMNGYNNDIHVQQCMYTLCVFSVGFYSLHLHVQYIVCDVVH